MADETRVQRRLKTADDTLGELVRKAQESGELQHMYGKPIDLSDDSPEWLANHILKQEGFAHPLVEKAKELEAARREAERLLEPLRRRRERLADTPYKPLEAHAFNQRREQVLAEYRRRLTDFNHAVLAYNMTVPEGMHRLPARLDREVARAGQEIPPLPLTAPDEPPPSLGFFRVPWRRRTSRTS